MLPTPYYERDGITIYCADCRDILPHLAPGSVDLVLTDPPYGIALQEHGRNGYNWSVVGDESQEVGGAVVAFCRERWPTIAFSSPKKPWPGEWRQHLVWDKGPAVGGGGDPTTCWKTTWEMIQVAKTPKLKGKRDSSVLKFWVGQRDYHYHPCQKPTSLLRYLIEKTTDSNDVVIDPFSGSGSVVVAAQETGRRAIGIEIEERYCEIAVRRLQQAVLPLDIPA